MTATDTPDDDPPKLPKGKELETVARMVDLREYLPMIDAARKMEIAVKFVEAVALDNPHYFKRIYQELIAPAWIEEARSLIRDQQFIQAVRVVREKTGWGLKEAKLYCDDLRDGKR